MAVKMVLFDMDGTVVQYEGSSFQSTWDAIGVLCGKKDEWYALRDHYLSKSLEQKTYAEWIDKQYALLKGIPIGPIMQEIFPPPYTPGFTQFCSYLKEQGVMVGIVSSGIGFVAEHIQQEVGLDFCFANSLHIEDGHFAGTGRIQVDLNAKGTIIRNLFKEYGFSPDQAAYFGDHTNDFSAWKAVGLPLGINLKDESCRAAVNAHFRDFHEALRYFVEHRIV